MRWWKIGWVAALFTIFVLFSVWYGGNGKPLTTAEGEALLTKLREAHSTTGSGEQGFIPNIEEMIPIDDGKEFYAVNLEQLKTGDAAREADRAYAGIVVPLLFERAGHPVFVSDRAGLMLGEYGRQVDRVAVVRYRSLRDMIKMASDPEMAKGSDYKFAALAHTEVFITRPYITFVQVRMMLVLPLIILGVAGLKLISFIASRKAT